LLAGLLVAIGLFYRQDEPPPNDADLQVHGSSVSASENNLAQIRKLPKKQLSFDSFDSSDGFAEAHGVTDYDTITQIENGVARNDTLVDAFLAQAQPAFIRLDAFLALPKFENVGEVSFWSQMFLGVPQVALTADQALRIEVIRSRQKDDFATATEAALRLRLLALRLTEGFAFGYPGQEIYEHSTTYARDLLNEPALPVSQQNALAHAYIANEPATAALQRGFMIDYQFDLSIFQDDLLMFEGWMYDGLSSAHGGRPISVLGKLEAHWLDYTFKPNTTRRQLADYYRELRQALNGPYSSINIAALTAERHAFETREPRLDSTPTARVTWLLTPNAGGCSMLNQMLPKPTELSFPYRDIADDRLLRIGFALRTYYNDHGTLPPALTALVPQYLAVIPADPFNDQPLCYDPARGLVYSVGTALKDNHGSRFLTMPVSDPNYRDPLLDDAQPTLALAFQNQK